MKTAGRENPNRGVTLPRNRAHGAVGQNRSRSIKWAAKQEKLQPKETCFFLTSTFIELIRHKTESCAVSQGFWTWRFASGSGLAGYRDHGGGLTPWHSSKNLY